MKTDVSSKPNGHYVKFKKSLKNMNVICRELTANLVTGKSTKDVPWHMKTSVSFVPNSYYTKIKKTPNNLKVTCR